MKKELRILRSSFCKFNLMLSKNSVCFFFFLFAEQNFVNGEVEEELDGTAQGVGDEGCQFVGQTLSYKEALEGGSKPCGEADEGDGKYNVDG